MDSQEQDVPRNRGRHLKASDLDGMVCAWTELCQGRAIENSLRVALTRPRCAAQIHTSTPGVESPTRTRQSPHPPAPGELALSSRAADNESVNEDLIQYPIE